MQRFAFLAVLTAALPAGAFAKEAAASPLLSPFAQCDAAVSAASKLPGRLPATLLPAIARVESGRLDEATGRVRPWPWTINVDGIGYFFASKEDVVATVQQLQARGKRSIDVGCMQVNLMHHPDAFMDLDEAFDPATNARYAVQFLLSLYQTTKNWPLAAAYYHSTTPEFGEEYQRLVFGKVMTPMGGAADPTLVTPSGNWPPAGVRFAAIPPASVTFGALAPPAQAQPTPTSMPSGNLPALGIGLYPNLFQAQMGAKH